MPDPDRKTSTRTRPSEPVFGLIGRRAVGCMKFYATSGGPMVGYWLRDSAAPPGAISDVIAPGGYRVGRAKTSVEARRLLRPDWSSAA